MPLIRRKAGNTIKSSLQESLFCASAIWAGWARDQRINLAGFAQTASFTSIANPNHAPCRIEQKLSMADRRREFKVQLVALWTQCAFHRKRDNNVPPNRIGPGFAHLRLGNNAWFRRGDCFRRIGSREIMRQLPPQAVVELRDIQSLPHAMCKSH